MTYIFFNQKFANGVNKVLSWFGINLMASFQDITQNMFFNLAKISHQADLQIYYVSLKLAIELYRWRVKCLLRNMLLKIASEGTYRIIVEFPRLFNVNLRLIWAMCYLRNIWLHWIQTWCANLSLTTDLFYAIIIFHGPNSSSCIMHHLKLGIKENILPS